MPTWFPHFLYDFQMNPSSNLQNQVIEFADGNAVFFYLPILRSGLFHATNDVEHHYNLAIHLDQACPTRWFPKLKAFDGDQFLTTLN